MLLFLGASIKNIDFDTDEESCHAIENILISEFEGKKLVRGERDTIDYLIENKSKFCRRSKAVLNKLKVKFSENFSITHHIDSRIVLESNTENIVFNDPVIEMPIKLFASRSLSDSVVLLCENMDDSKIYSYCAEHYRISKNYKSIKIEKKLRAGGGSTTYQEIENIIQHKSEICITVLDSDKKSPYCSFGDTADLCIKANDNTWPIKIITTESREIENTIPLRLLYECADIALHNKIDKLNEIINLNSDICKYLDIKNQTKLHWVLDSFREGSPSREYWISELLNNNVIENECTQKQECSNRKACECDIYDGISNNIASSLLGWLEGRSAHKSNELIDDIKDKEWLNIGKQIFEWCCAPEIYRI